MGRKRKKFPISQVSKNLFLLLNNGEGFEKNKKRLIDAGFGKTTITSWISGDRNPTWYSLQKIAEIFEIDLNEWFKEIKPFRKR